MDSAEDLLMADANAQAPEEGATPAPIESAPVQQTPIEDIIPATSNVNLPKYDYVKLVDEFKLYPDSKQRKFILDDVLSNFYINSILDENERDDVTYGDYKDWLMTANFSRLSALPEWKEFIADEGNMKLIEETLSSRGLLPEPKEELAPQPPEPVMLSPVEPIAPVDAVPIPAPAQEAPADTGITDTEINDAFGDLAEVDEGFETK